MEAEIVMKEREKRRQTVNERLLSPGMKSPHRKAARTAKALFVAVARQQFN